MEKSMVIVGAGIAGLSTGCYARLNGYRTTILEAHNIPGDLQPQGHLLDTNPCLQSDNDVPGPRGEHHSTATGSTATPSAGPRIR